MKANVLGTNYEIIISNIENKNYDGFCDTSVSKIFVDEMTPDENSKKDLKAYQKQVIRHELIHAFLYESGLDVGSDWAKNEEIVDYFAIQFPKMLRAFKEADCL